MVFSKNLIAAYNRISGTENYIFHSSALHRVRPILPVPLTELILVAKSGQAFSASQLQLEALEARLSADQRILRAGDILSLSQLSKPSSYQTTKTLQYEIQVCEPVLQGHYKSDYTKLVVLAPRRTLDSEPPSPSSEDGSTTEGDGLEVGESFLMNSVLGNPMQLLHHADSAKPDSRSPQLVLRGVIAPSIGSPGLEDLCISVWPQELLKIGVFTGDWVSQPTAHEYNQLEIA